MLDVDTQLLRTFVDDPRVKSAWSYGGQIRFKSQLDETIYKVTSLSATYDTMIKPSSSSNGNSSSTNFATRQQMRNRVPPFNDT